MCDEGAEEVMREEGGRGEVGVVDIINGIGELIFDVVSSVSIASFLRSVFVAFVLSFFLVLSIFSRLLTKCCLLPELIE